MRTSNTRRGERETTTIYFSLSLWPVGWGSSASRGGSLQGASSTSAVPRGCRRRRGTTLTARWEGTGNADMRALRTRESCRTRALLHGVQEGREAGDAGQRLFNQRADQTLSECERCWPTAL